MNSRDNITRGSIREGDELFEYKSDSDESKNIEERPPQEWELRYKLDITQHGFLPGGFDSGDYVARYTPALDDCPNWYKQVIELTPRLSYYRYLSCNHSRIVMEQLDEIAFKKYEQYTTETFTPDKLLFTYRVLNSRGFILSFRRYVNLLFKFDEYCRYCMKHTCRGSCVAENFCGNLAGYGLTEYLKEQFTYEGYSESFRTPIKYDGIQRICAYLKERWGVSPTFLASLSSIGWVIPTKFGESIISLLRDWSSKLRDSMVFLEPMLGTIIVVRQAMISNSFESLALAWTQYLLLISTHFKHDLVKFKDELMKESVRAFGNKYEVESASQDVDEMRGLVEKILGGEFVVLLRRMLLSLVSYRWVGKDISSQLVHYLGRPEKRVAIVDLVPIMLQAFYKMVQGAEAVMAGKPVCDVLFAPDQVESVKLKVKDLLAYEERLYTGLPTEGYMEQRKFVMEGQELVECMETVVKDMHAYDTRKESLVNMKRHLNSVLSTINSSVHASKRQPPLAIVIHGHPGIGKSLLMEVPPRIMSHLKGREYSNDQIYTRSRTSDYWEGYLPWSQPYIHYSEVGNEHVQQVRSKGNHIMEELNSVIDGTRYACDMAFGEKGKVFAIPEMVIIDTNNPDMHISELMSNVSALKRRFIYIEAIVKDEFCLIGSTALDVAKSLECGGNMLDRYYFNVYRYKPNGQQSVRVPYAHRCSIDELTACLHGITKNHIMQQSEVLEKDIYSGLNDQLFHLDAQDALPHDNNLMFEDDVKEFGEGEMIGPLADIQVESASSDWTDDLLILLEHYSAVFMMILTICFTGVLEHVLRIEDLGTKCVPVFIIVACLLLKNPFVNAILMILCLIVWYFRKNVQSMMMTHVKNKLYGRVRSYRNRTWNKVKYYLGFGTLGTLHSAMLSHHYAALLLCIAGIRVGYLCWRSYRNGKKIYTEAHSEFQMTSDKNDALNEKEDLYNSQLAQYRVHTKFDQVWNAMDLDAFDVCFNGNSYDLQKVIAKNVKRLIVRANGQKNVAFLMGISGSYAIMNKHMLFKGKNLIQISMSDEANSPHCYELNLSLDECVDIDDDIILFNTRKVRFRDITKHIVDRLCEGPVKGRLGATPANFYRHQTITVNDRKGGTITLNDPYRYEIEHETGMCGLPLIGDITRGRAAIVGIHGAGSRSTRVSFSASFVRKDILEGIECLKNMNPLMDLHSEGAFSFSRELPNKKSNLRFESYPYLQLYGKIPGKTLVNMRSQLVKTKPYDLDDFMEEEFGFKRSVYYGIPYLKPFTNRKGEYYNPYSIAMNKMNKDPALLDQEIMRTVVNKIVIRVVNGLKERGVKDLSPLTLNEAINGSDQDGFLRRVNANTSSGFGFQGKKYNHIPLIDEDMREMTDELKGVVLEMMECYEQGIGCKIIIRACPKDEPRDIKKVVVGKTRLFYILPIHSLIIMRMFLAPFYTNMIAYGDLFCTAIGIDMLRGADFMITNMLDFSEYFMEGDYSGYDVNNPFDIGHAAATIVERVLESMGYNFEAMSVVRGILSDGLFPVIAMCGDLISKAGMQPSGKYATAEDNSLRGLIMMMYAWYQNPNLEGKDFFDYVLPIIYGDDLLASVKPDVLQYYNNTTYQSVVREDYNMDFTTAEKGTDMKPYLTIDEISFLKRKFKIHPQSGKWVAQLDMNSIYKTLEWTLPSKTVSVEAQLASTLQSACWEFFLYCEDANQYYRVQTYLRDIYERVDQGGELTLPTYNYVYDSLFDTRDVEDDGYYVEGFASKIANVLKGRKIEDVEDKSDPEPSTRGRTASFGATQCAERILFLQDELEDLKLDIDPEILVRSSSLKGQMFIDPRYSQAIHIYREIKDLQATLTCLSRREARKHVFVTESLHMETDSIDPVHRENLNDFGGNDEEKEHLGSSFYPDIGNSDPNPIERFFERPIEIANFEIVTGSHTDIVLDVWELYTSEASVRAKLRNFAYLYGDLEVTINMSGSPFSYGRLMVSYQPWGVENENLLSMLGAVSTDANNRPLLLTYLSQAIGRVTMDLKSNTPVTMLCPFIGTKPMYRLHNDSTTAISDVTPFEDFEYAGELYLNTINLPYSTSPTPSNITVQVFANLKNVRLGCLTGTLMEITTESLEMKDEIEMGPVEKIASSAVSAAKYLESVPIISPMAKASRAAAMGIGAAASVYGWSKPPMMDNPVFVKNRPFGNSALTIGHSTIEKVTLDPKQELTVDPRIGAIDEDQMSIAAIARRESLLTTFTWSDATELLDPIFRCRVTPDLDAYNQGLTRTYCAPTALSFVARPFQYWHGTIDFRLEVVCSNFHRGKLAIFYEPNTMMGALIEGDLDLNKQHITFVDIQKTQDVTLRVPWAQENMFERIDIPGRSVFNHGPAFSYTAAPYTVNGVIIVVPFTKLRSNEAVSSIEINVYVKSEDIHFAQVQGTNLPTERYYTESHMSENIVVMAPQPASRPKLYEYCFGEEPVSFRSILKRYVTTQYLAYTTTSSHTKVRVVAPAFVMADPVYGGTLAGEPTLLSYLPYAFVGIRGGMRKRVRVLNNKKFTGGQYMQKCIATLSASSNAMVATFTSELAVSKQIGSVQFVPATNGGVEFEIPYYTRNLMSVSFAEDMESSVLMDTSYANGYTLEYDDFIDSGDGIYVVEDSAIGEDFTFIRFNGAPWYSVT